MTNFRPKILGLLTILCSTLIPAYAGDQALLVGINEYANAGSTPGCEEDVAALRELLITRFKFSKSDIKMLLGSAATAQAIRTAMRYLIENSKPGDRIFFLYAGHGAQAKDDDGDEADGKDEVLAPYDVSVAPPNIPMANFIRDDEVNQWIADLSGRRVVMLFDSCHSGTISRGLKNKREIVSRYLRPKVQPSSRGIGDAAYSDIPPPKSRDLEIVTEANVKPLVNGVVIFSAASPYQEAQPIQVKDQMRGALSYLFEQQVKSGMPTVEALKLQLKKEMAHLAETGELPPGGNREFQVPEVEYATQSPLGNQPLWGNVGSAGVVDYTAPVVALHNPLSSIKVGLTMMQKGCDTRQPETCRPQPAGAIARYQFEELFQFAVEVSEPVYLYVLVFSKDNQASCVFPSVGGEDTDNHVAQGKVYFPRYKPNKEPYEVYARAPAGYDVWVALASRTPFKLGEREDYTWDEVFQRIGLPKLQTAISNAARSRGVGSRVKLAEDGWQAATLVVETVP